LAGQVRNRIARLNADGTLDPGFNPGVDSWVYSLAVQANGQILAGGTFDVMGGQTRHSIARLDNTATASDILSYDGGAITWLRGGTGPEVWRTTFEHATNGAAWTMLGAGARVPGGWQLGSVTVPLGTIRARGYASGGYHNASGGIIENGIGALAITTQPAGRTNNAGTTAEFSVYVAGSAPSGYQWRKNGANLTDGGSLVGANAAALNVSGVVSNDVGGYDVIVSNAYGSVTSAVASLAVVDPAINAQPSSQTAQVGGNATLSVTAAGTGVLGYQWWKDGQVLVGATDASLVRTNLQAADAGNYKVVVSGTYGSVTSAVVELCVNLAPPDPDFNPGTSSYVYSLAVQADGKILQGGSFTTAGGLTRNYIARLNANGTVDTNFNPGANSTVYSLAVQADGRILAGGGFSTLGGLSRSRVGRLYADGTVDTNFNPGASSTLYVLGVQADGKILLGGSFTTVGGLARNYIARLNADGTVDTSFTTGASNAVYALAVQADGRILLGGNFTTVGGLTRNYLARLNANGTVDTSFTTGASNAVYALAVQADGRILVGGAFTTLGGQARNYLARLNAAGTLDTGFNPSPNSTVYALALQADGRTLAGGAFATLGGLTRNCIARMNGTGPATDALGYNGSTISWSRGGTAPEVWRTTFEYTTNGTQWTMLGAGTRTTGGWQLGAASVPPGSLRARGYTTGGYYGGSGGIVETVAPVDVDADGVPDWWTSRYFGHPTGQSGDCSRAADDASSTGQNNLFKYVADLDPTNPVSVFRLRIEGVPDQPTQKRLIFGPRWDSRVYVPLFCTDLVSGVWWTNLPSASTSDDGAERTVTDLDAAGNGKFYRVRISVPCVGNADGP
ncbi:MAG: hypothetical protein NTY02_05570, partial [Acidobacteria bacterium]|nr:hypothetical protein [Acidobacteriota bacterium]